MEHRWGRRIPVKIPIRLICACGVTVLGQTQNISFSGALIQTARTLRFLTRLQIEVVLPQELGGKRERITAHVTRRVPNGAAIEWCDYAPRAVRALLLALDSPAARSQSHALSASA